MNDDRYSRMLPLTGARNVRDLGGYATTDGRHVRWGMLFRGGSLAGITMADWAILQTRGIATFCDLRSVRERVAEPFAFAGEPGVAYDTRDYRASFAELRETMRTGFASAEAARAGMAAGYRQLPIEQAPALRQLFRRLGDGDLPLLFYCVAGKDRAGMAAAIVLTALGVPRASVVADYEITNQAYDVAATLRAGGGRMAHLPPGVALAIACADPAYMEAALAAIDDRPGGFERYLADMLGVGEDDLDRLKARLLA